MDRFAPILALAAVLVLLERAAPLHRRGREAREHLGPNLALTALALATSATLDAGIALALAAQSSAGLALLPRLSLPRPLELALAWLVLDLATYASHASMHAYPALWRVHRVHHADRALDVTTSFRQHPGETALRAAFAGGCALALGTGPAAFALYRLASALCALLEHANLRVPSRADAWLSLFVCWPGFHKVHHARDARFHGTNFGNLVSWWDRLFGTFTPSAEGARVAFGLDDDRRSPAEPA